MPHSQALGVIFLLISSGVFMKRLLLPILAVSFIVLASGCSGTIPVNYTPQNYVRCTGAAEIGEFSYSPYEKGIVGKPNQIQNTAVGSVYLGQNVADLVKRATALELEKSGIILDDSCGYKVNGDVVELKAGDLGYSIQWWYSVKYTIENSETAAVLHEDTYTPPMRKTGKFGQASDYGPAINELIVSGYELFIKDPKTQKILGEAVAKKTTAQSQ